MNGLVRAAGLPPMVAMVVDQFPSYGGRGYQIAKIAKSTLGQAGPAVSRASNGDLTMGWPPKRGGKLHLGKHDSSGIAGSTRFGIVQEGRRCYVLRDEVEPLASPRVEESVSRSILESRRRRASISISKDRGLATREATRQDATFVLRDL